MIDDLPEIDRILLALGNMNVRWGHYEDGFFILLSQVLGGLPHHAEYALRGELDMKRAASVMKNAALINEQLPARDHVLKLVALTDRPLREHRNRFVHDPIYSGSGREGHRFERHYYRVEVKKPQSRQKPEITVISAFHVTPDLLAAFTECIYACETYLGKILHHIWDEPEEPCPIKEVEVAAVAAEAAIASYMALTKSLASK